MTDTIEAVRRHYDAEVQTDTMVSRFTEALEAIERPLTAAKVAGFDQFHVGGLAATVTFAGLLDLGPDDVVLDAGSGLGGPSRHMAETFGCAVHGVDLTPAYVAIARLLADETGLSGRVAYQVGDLTALPFAAGRFDLVYSQHVMMNVRDRRAAYGELRRVLKAGGRFAFHDVLAADGEPEVVYPTPWAETAASSTLLTEADTRAALRASGLVPRLWNDVTAEAIAWFGQIRPPSPQAPTLATLMGPRFAAMGANLAGNLRDGRLRLVMAVCDAV